MQTSACIAAHIRDGSDAALHPCKWCSMSAALNFVILVMSMYFITLYIHLSIFILIFQNSYLYRAIHKTFHYYLGNCKRQYVMIRIIIINSLPNSVLTVNPFPDQNKIVIRLCKKAWSAGSTFLVNHIQGANHPIQWGFQIQAWRKSEQTRKSVQCLRRSRIHTQPWAVRLCPVLKTAEKCIKSILDCII